MFKYIKAFFRGSYKILFAYPRIRKYAKNKDKFPIEERYTFLRKLILTVLKSLRVDINIEGIEKINEDETFMVVCNHQSVMDALTMISLFERPISIVAKKETKEYPFVGKATYFIDGIFLDREDVRDSVRMIRDCRNYLKSGRSVVIFPEGTRSKDENHTLGEYKAGSLKPAFETKSKIVVMAFDGSYKVLSKKYKGNQRINVRVVDIIDPSEYEGVNTNDLIKRIELETRETLEKVRKQ